MAGVTEVLTLPLKEGEYPYDPSSPLYTKWSELLIRIPKIDGVQRVRWGQILEDPSTVLLFVDWDSVIAHEKFQSNKDHEYFKEAIFSFARGEPSNFHVRFDPHPNVAGFNGITEVVFAWFTADLNAADQEAFQATYEKFASVTSAKCTDIKGTSGAWALEEITIPGKDVKGKLFVSLNSWTSAQAHGAFAQTQIFKDNIGMVRGGKGLETIKINHVASKLVET